MPSIKPQVKMSKATYTLPDPLISRIAVYATNLSDSTPDYVVAEAMTMFLDREERQQKQEASKPGEAKRKAVA